MRGSYSAHKIQGITMPVSELGPGNAANDGEEDARQFILQVKQTVERCLAQGMDKAQMFRAIREEGLHPGAAFAVYKEIRDQNRVFFQEYYCMIDLKEQRERLDRLIRAYRGGVRVPETATPLIATEETDGPVSMMEWPDQQTLQAWLSNGGDHQLAPTAWTQHTAHLPAMEQVLNYGLPVAIAWRQPAEHLPAWEQMQNHGLPVANGAFQEPAWPPQQQAFPLPDALPLHNYEETAANGGFRGLVWPQQEVQAGRQLQQPAANNGWCQWLTWPQHQ
ncbi:hypothetical protein EJB05_35450 [Eragrostis curvula]|uniref:Uncharacterized protein n=1 Tax=Eragrostis curvula TaxID=38414 RepID=A0A5J9U6N0_9POAL|nr:hypothetical protein EJB05_35450 [Eragrostis curvula]